MSPLALSAGLHLAVASLLAVLLALGRGGPERIEFEIIEKPAAVPSAFNLVQDLPKPKEEPRLVPPVSRVFGISKKALTSDNDVAESVAVKQGNTVVAAPDNEKLKPGDEESLPIPADEYLVTKMPSVNADVRIPYPTEAFKKKIEGKVIMDLLIDAEGLVREVRLISGPGFGLDEAAAAAIRNFKFQPAEINGKPVAVRIPFTYNFLLKTD
jgi:protein TonB